MYNVTILILLRDVSIGAAITAALILMVRLLFGRMLSARAKYYLWLLLALRLVLPVTPESPLSLMNYVPRSGVVLASERETAGQETAAYQNGQETADAIVKNTFQTQGVESALTWDWADVLLSVWLIGAAVMLMVYIILYILTERRMTALPICEDKETQLGFLRLKQALRVSDRIKLVSGEAGMLGGLFHPTLVIPTERRGEDAAPILIHELMHYKYGDLWLYTLFRLLIAVYWFHPVVWLCFWVARHDSEKACDERVLESGLIPAYTYAETLYREGRLRSGLSPMPQTTFGGGHGLKGRIKEISRFRKRGKWVTALAIVLALVITACGITSVPGSASESVPEQSELFRMTGYKDIDEYVDSLQPELGHFGWTFEEHVTAGYLQESEGTWETSSNWEQTFVTEKELFGQPMEVTYVFSVTLFTRETTWRQVLTEIHVTVPENMEVSDLGAHLLESWSGLNASNTFVKGSYRTPISVGDYLEDDHWDRVGELAVQDGRAETPEQGWSILPEWSFASLNYWPSKNTWQLNGTGMALYLTREDYS